MPNGEHYAIRKPLDVSKWFSTYLSNGSTTSAVGNYAGGVERFKYTCPTNRRVSLERMLVYVEDTGAFDAEKYGNGITLTNGIRVYVRNPADEIITALDGGLAVKTNAQWGRLCYDADVKKWGTGNEILVVRWTFSRAGAPVFLTEGHYLSVELNDTFVNLVDHTFLVQGTFV